VLLVLALLAAFFWLDSPWSWVLVGIAAVVEFGEVFFWMWWGGKRRHAHVGAETLIGRTAVVALPCRPAGQVRVDGEIWQARCETGVGEGEQVVIRGIDRLTLLVERSE
jgi:membrane protein implicated in regulation of membrane protease activity